MGWRDILGCSCYWNYFFLLTPFWPFGFIRLSKNSETVWITTPPVRLGLFIKGPKSLISPVSRWVALHWIAASRIGRSFSERGTGQFRPDLEGTFMIASSDVSTGHSVQSVQDGLLYPTGRSLRQNRFQFPPWLLILALSRSSSPQWSRLLLIGWLSVFTSKQTE